MRQGTSVRPRIPSVAPSLPAPNTPKHDASDLDGAPEPKRRCASSVGDDETDEPHQVSNVQERRFKGWKSVYKERSVCMREFRAATPRLGTDLQTSFRVGYNWKWGIYTMKIFKGHTNGVTCELSLRSKLNTSPSPPPPPHGLLSARRPALAVVARPRVVWS